MIEGQVAYIFISDKPKKKNFQAGMFLLHLGLRYPYPILSSRR